MIETLLQIGLGIGLGMLAEWLLTDEDAAC